MVALAHLSAPPVAGGRPQGPPLHSRSARLGPCEVTAQIGVGGMGEVYQATDTKLKRQVAIKVLPQTVASDGDGVARFRREAQVLASLNHPHIAPVSPWLATSSSGQRAT